jgi:aromatase
MSGRTDNRVVIDAPLDEVWTVTNDVANWPWLFGEYASAEIVEQTADYVRFRLTTRPDEDNRSWSWVSERRLDPANHVVRARRVETGPFEYMNILWQYRPVAGGVEMRWIQDFHLKPDAPIDDAAMTDRINQRTPVEMARIKRLVESGERPPVAGIVAGIARR